MVGTRKLFKTSHTYKVYADKLARVKNPKELLFLTNEIAYGDLDVSKNEKLGLMASCAIIAKEFDRLTAKGVTFEDSGNGRHGQD